METDGAKVVQQLFEDVSTPILFLKNMSHHLLDLDLNFLKRMQNIFLTRDPKDMILSFIKTIPNPTMSDLGYQHQSQLIELLKTWDHPIAVINSKDILDNPENSLQKICNWLDIPFEKSMLHWPKGPRKEDGIWAPYWYENVHNSTEFGTYQEKSEAVPKPLQPLLEECYKYYKEIMKYSIL